MSELKYTEEHEWVRVDGDTAVIGISAYAQEQLGDIVFVDLPETGKSLDQGDEAAVIESVKAASEVYAPIAGTVLETNQSLTEDPGKVNADPTGDGWFLKIEMRDPGQVDGLMDETAYKAYVGGLE